MRCAKFVLQFSNPLVRSRDLPLERRFFRLEIIDLVFSFAQFALEQ